MRNSPSHTAEPSGSWSRMKRPVANSVSSSSAVPEAAARAIAAGPCRGVAAVPGPGARTSAPSATAKGARRAGAGISARWSSPRHRAFLRVPKAWRNSGGTWSSAFTFAGYATGPVTAGRLAVLMQSPDRLPSPISAKLMPDCCGKGIDILLGCIKRTHPAHFPGRLVPVIETEGLPQPVCHALRKDGKDAVGLGFLRGLHTVNGVDGGAQPGCHRIGMRGGAQPEVPLQEGDEL